MMGNPQELAASRFVRQMALFYASTFVALGVHLPFLPVWLAAKGLEPQTIGVVLAMPMIFRLFAIPLATRAADRHDALRAVIMAAALAALVGFGALGFTSRRGRDRRGLCAGGDRLHAAVRAVRRLCAARPRAAPAGLWAGAAVGLGGVHRVESRRRLSARHHRRPRPDLADRRRRGALRGGGLGAAAARHTARGQGGRDAARPRAAARSARSSRSPPRRA